MLILVIYDITEDEVRQKVANLLLQYGFKRIQRSAYIGKIPNHILKELEIKLRKIMKTAHGNIQIFKITKQQYRSRIEIGYREEPPLDSDIDVIY